MLSAPRSPDAHRLLLRALLAAFPDASLLASSATPWASATFVGARHSIALRFDYPAAAEAAAALLGDMEFQLHRHLVADIVGTVTDAVGRLDVAALTVEDR